MSVTRCEWAVDPLSQQYHDTEWGTPVHDDLKLFEFLVLEGAQAGLSWITILKKREGYREAFDNFDPLKISEYDDKKIVDLMHDERIIRNRLKINSAVQNARSFLQIQSEYGSFDKYIWQFVNGKTIKSSFSSLKDFPTRTREAEIMSKDLLKRGFKFVGPTICYSYMQAVGLVNDHQVQCFRYHE